MIKPKKVSRGQLSKNKLIHIIFGKSGTGKNYFKKRKTK